MEKRLQLSQTAQLSETAKSTIRACGLPIPAPGEVTQITPECGWMRLPLPYALDHINIWIIEDGDGWTIVDTGVCTERTKVDWAHIQSSVLRSKPIKRVIATHMHADHVGMAGWLVQAPPTRLWMTRLEYLTCRMLMSDTGRQPPEAATRFYTAVGWTEEDFKQYHLRFGDFGRRIFNLPGSFYRMVDGLQFTVGSHTWEVIIGAGHSPEHACLYCPALKLFISGDQVLPRISSNVSVLPTEPWANPLEEWLASLGKVCRAVPDDVLVLPSHDEPFYGLHARARELREKHLIGLDRVCDALTKPLRAIDIFPVLFRRPVSANTLHMASGEAVAHLNYLLSREEIAVHYDDKAIAWYQRR